MACNNGTCYNVGCGNSNDCDGCSGTCGKMSRESGGDSGCTKCQYNCSDDCTSCTGDCQGSCEGACQDACEGNCEGSCKSSCNTACDTGCYSTEAIDLYQTLSAGLNRKILATDLININRMIQLEAARRKKSISSQSFTAKNKATSQKIKALQSNLETIGHKTSKNADVRIKSWKATGQELIDKSLEAFNETLSHS